MVVDQGPAPAPLDRHHFLDCFSPLELLFSQQKTRFRNTAALYPVSLSCQRFFRPELSFHPLLVFRWCCSDSAKNRNDVADRKSSCLHRFRNNPAVRADANSCSDRFRSRPDRSVTRNSVGAPLSLRFSNPGPELTFRRNDQTLKPSVKLSHRAGARHRPLMLVRP